MVGLNPTSEDENSWRLPTNREQFFRMTIKPVGSIEYAKVYPSFM
jgi:hypothetical protein